MWNLLTPGIEPLSPALAGRVSTTEPSQCTSPKQPVSCIEPGLAIRFIWGHRGPGGKAVCSDHPETAPCSPQGSAPHHEPKSVPRRAVSGTKQGPAPEAPVTCHKKRVGAEGSHGRSQSTHWAGWAEMSPRHTNSSWSPSDALRWLGTAGLGG